MPLEAAYGAPALAGSCPGLRARLLKLERERASGVPEDPRLMTWDIDPERYARLVAAARANPPRTPMITLLESGQPVKISVAQLRGRSFSDFKLPAWLDRNPFIRFVTIEADDSIRAS